MKTLIRYWPPIALMLAALWLRLANLGYSDYQGDEIKALAQPALGQSWLDFIMQQRKGPTQFLISRLGYLIDPTFSNELLMRLPFALASLLAVFIFYEMIRLHTDRMTSLFAGMFFAVNGLFIGLTRIVQYQAFVLLFSCLALYSFSLALTRERWRISGLYIGFTLWALAVLTHYDGVFIAPFVAYLLYRWVRIHPEMRAAEKWKHLVLPAVLSLLLLAGFYAALFVSSTPETRLYWLERLTGAGDVDLLVFSSLVIFRLYNPLFAAPVTILLGGLSLTQIKRSFPFWLWFLFPWLVLEFLVTDPGTHIYTYLLPACVLAGVGLSAVLGWVGKIPERRVALSAVIILPVLIFGLLFGVAHFIFVDYTPEYPWEARQFLFWKLERPGKEYKLWVFGFPYHRNWEEIRDFVASNPGTGYYVTNENDNISAYYVPEPTSAAKAGYYILVRNPTSFRPRLADEKTRYWMNTYPPVKTILNRGRVAAEIYLMPAGTYEQIRAQGY